MTMPPMPLWFRGRTTIGQFFQARLFAGDARGRYRLEATRANGCPAFAVYQRDETGRFRPSSLQVLVLDGGLIAEMHSFLVSDRRLFARFGASPEQDEAIH